jgi:type IV pilus biogenesis protein CpaD/CtpE
MNRNAVPATARTRVPTVVGQVDSGDDRSVRVAGDQRLEVGEHEFLRLLADLNSDIHVVVVLVAGVPHSARQVITPDLQQHRDRR